MSKTWSPPRNRYTRTGKVVGSIMKATGLGEEHHETWLWARDRVVHWLRSDVGIIAWSKRFYKGKSVVFKEVGQYPIEIGVPSDDGEGDDKVCFDRCVCVRVCVCVVHTGSRLKTRRCTCVKLHTHTTHAPTFSICVSSSPLRFVITVPDATSSTSVTGAPCRSFSCSQPEPKGNF